MGDNLHNHPDAYWYADCHRFTLDCSHLVEPLENAPRVVLRNWLIESVAYDRQRMILELEMNTGERFQYFRVPRRVAIGLVQEPAKYMKEFIERTYRFERVRGRYYTEREILMEMARAMEGLLHQRAKIFYRGSHPRIRLARGANTLPLKRWRNCLTPKRRRLSVGR